MSVIVKYLIQSGTMQEAKHYARENKLSPSQWIYLDRPEKAIGLRGSGAKVIKVGTYYDNRLVFEINEVLLSQDIIRNL